MNADQVLTYYAYLLDKNKKERLDYEARSRQSK
jgi:cbb3-type cytochrome oxidase subunit 3